MKPQTKINIGLLIATLDGGGAERMLVQLANALVSRKVPVSLYLVNKKGPFLNDVSDKVQLIDLKAKHGVKSVFFDLRKILKTSRPDIIISTQPHVSTVLGLAGIGLPNKPTLVFREANTPSIKYSNYGVLARTAYKIGYSFADHYIAVSEGVKQDMISYYGMDPATVTRIYNPLVNHTIFEKTKEPVDHPWIKGGYKIIMTMGRMVPQKDHITLLHAFSILKKTMDVKLMIMGDTEQDPVYAGRVRGQISKLGLQDSVELAGFKSNPFKYLSKASLFVLSSEYEGLPGSLVQAMACGCPVVSTDCPSGPAEILEDGKYGKLVSVGDAEQLALAMADSLNRQHQIVKIKKRADNFSIEESVDQHLSLIQNLMQKKDRNE